MSDLAGLRLLKNKDIRIAKLKKALAESESEVDVLKQKLSLYEGSKLGSPRTIRKRASRSKKAKLTSFILGITDNHFTQIVENDLSGGNLHNESIAIERINSVMDQANLIFRNAESTTGIDEIVIWLGGDHMVNADLHPHFRRITKYEPHEELGIVEGILIDALDRLFDSPISAKSIRFHGSLSNHGRDGKKEDVSAEIAYRRSFDVTLYNHVLPRYKVPFHIEKTYWGVEHVGGVKTLLHHGHRISMSENHQGVIQPNWNQVKKRLSHPRHRGTKLWMNGHFHTAMELINDQFTYVSAGSTVGQDGYSYDLLFPDNVPSQPLVEIVDGRVKTVHRLECD